MFYNEVIPAEYPSTDSRFRYNIVFLLIREFQLTRKSGLNVIIPLPLFNNLTYDVPTALHDWRLKDKMLLGASAAVNTAEEVSFATMLWRYKQSNVCLQ